MTHRPQKLLPSPTPGESEVRLGIVTVPVPRSEVKLFFLTSEYTHNLMVMDDRDGLLDRTKEPIDLLRSMSGENADRHPHKENQLQAIRDHLDKRAKANGPLRWKKDDSLKSIKAVGPLWKVVQSRIPGAISATIHRKGHGFVIRALVQKEVVPFNPPTFHTKKARVFGISASTDGVVIDEATLGQMVACENFGRREQRTARYNIPYSELIKPGFIQGLIEHFFKPKGLVVGVDLNSVRITSNDGKEAIKLLRRGFRSRKAAGAVEVRMVSPLGREAQEGAEAEQRRGADPKSVRMLQTSALLMCPDCASMVDVRLSLTTGAPIGRTCFCSSCKRRVDLAAALAYRARAWSMESWCKSVLQPGYDPRRGLRQQRARRAKEEQEQQQQQKHRRITAAPIHL